MKGWKENILKYDPPFIFGSAIACLGVSLYNIAQQLLSSNYNTNEIMSYFSAIAGIFFITLGIRKDLKKYTTKKKIPIFLLGIIVTLLLQLCNMAWESVLSLIVVYIIPYVIAKSKNDTEKTY